MIGYPKGSLRTHYRPNLERVQVDNVTFGLEILPNLSHTCTSQLREASLMPTQHGR